MCGLLGFSGKTPLNIDKIKLLYTYNSLQRGEDSIGMYSPLNGVYKKAGKPVDLIPKMNIKEDNYFIGHVRSGTSGGKTDKQAHPFQFNELIGVMNGTTSNHWSLVDKYGLDKSNYDVDSEAVFAIIQKVQSFSVLGELSGGCAILTADTRNPEILYAYRNLERPLYRGQLNGCMYISSIEESLAIIGCERTTELKPNTLYTIVDGEITNTKPIKVNVYTEKSKVDISGKSKMLFNDLNGKNSHYIQRYMLFDSPSYIPRNLVENFKYGEWYFCYGYNKDNITEVYVKDGESKSVTIETRAFTYMASFPHTGDYMKLTVNLFNTGDKKKKVTIPIDTIVQLNKYTKDYKVEFYEVGKDDSIWTVNSSYIRPLSDVELLEYKKEIKDKAKDNTPVVLNTNHEIDNVEDYTEGQYPKTDILNKFSGPPWRDQIRNNQLRLLPNIETTIEENIDEEDVVITHKEFKTIFTNIEFGLEGIQLNIAKNILIPYNRRELLDQISEIKTYINGKLEKYTNIING